MVCPLFTSSFCIASESFNSAFLTDDIAEVADLERLEQGKQQPGQYMSEIYVNNSYLFSRYLRFIDSDLETNDSGHLAPCFDYQLLVQFKIKQSLIEDQKQQSCINLKSIFPDARIKYDFNNQKLSISLPQAILEQQIRAQVPETEWDNGIVAGILNYSLTGSISHESNSQFLLLNSGFNIGPWRYRNISSLSSYQTKKVNYNHFSVLSNYIERAIIPLKSEILIGAGTSSSQVFENTNFIGVRLYSAENMLPEVQKGFAPIIRGTANSQAKVVVKQNGYIIYQSYVAAGPFVFNDLNPTSFSGDLEVTVFEEDGSQHSFTIPYSSIPLLQRAGHLNYNLILGTLKNPEADSQNTKFLELTLTRGSANGYTLYGGTQIAKDYQSVAIGFGKSLGSWGAIALDAIASNTLNINQHHTQGESYRLLYAKSLNSLGTNVQFSGSRYSTFGYYTLNESSKLIFNNQNRTPEPEIASDTDNQSYNPYGQRKGNYQLSLNQNVSKFGALFLSYNLQNYWNTPIVNKMMYLGYSSSINNIFYSLNFGFTESTTQANTKYHDQSVSFNISIPMTSLFKNSKYKFKDRSFINGNFYKNNTGNMTWQTGLSGTLLKDNNLSYNLTQSQNGSSNNNTYASLRYRSYFGEFDLGYSNANSHNTLSYRASGGLIAHENGITLSQPLGNTNILVVTDKVKDIKFENQAGLKTNAHGYAVIPYASDYHVNRITLKADSLNVNTEVLNNVKTVVPTRGAIVRAEFQTKIGYRMLLNIKYKGQYVPFASTIKEIHSETSSMVGEEGLAFLSGLPPKGELLVSWGSSNSKQCKADYDFNDELSKANGALIELEVNCVEP